MRMIGESYGKASGYLGASLLLVLVTTGNASAQSEVESRVQKLEEAIQALEHRVVDLEDQINQRSVPAPGPAGKVNWRKLQKGMSEGDVQRLLGSPSKVDAFGSFTIWHYDYPFGGEVKFDRGSRVNGWHEP